MEPNSKSSCKVCIEEGIGEKHSFPDDAVLEVEFEKSLHDYTDFTHAAHGMIYTLQQGKFEGNSQKANILVSLVWQ